MAPHKADYCAAINCSRSRENNPGLLFVTFPAGETNLERSVLY